MLCSMAHRDGAKRTLDTMQLTLLVRSKTVYGSVEGRVTTCTLVNYSEETEESCLTTCPFCDTSLSFGNCIG